MEKNKEIAWKGISVKTGFLQDTDKLKCKQL